MIARGGSASGGGPRPSGGYTASAVHFDGAARLVCDALAATDGAFSLYAGWFKFSASQPTQSLASIWTVDPADAYSGYGFFTEGDLVFGAAAPLGADVSSDGTCTTAVWRCILCSIPNGGTRQIYFGDTDSLDFDNAHGADNEFDGLPFYFGDDGFGDGAVMDVADFRMWTDQGLDLSVEANRRLFIDASGKPVDPATATLTLGTPTILFSGDSATFGTNTGDGGAFVLTGSLTNASTSPSD